MGPGPRLRLITRGGLKRLASLGLLLLLGAALAYPIMLRMPGKSHRGPLPPLEATQVTLGDTLHRHVTVLAEEIGPRSVLRPVELAEAADYLESQLSGWGYAVERDSFDASGVPCHNLVAERAGTDRAQEIVVIGGHYDSVIDAAVTCPGANDNATGAAATLEIARAFADRSPRRTVRFVLFVNEEPPHFQRPTMGSLVYSRRCRERGDQVVAMLSLETIGYYTDAPNTQNYPAPLGLLYPSEGNFIAFVGNIASRRLVKDAIGSFRRHCAFPSEGAALPGWMVGVGWSDQWAFWQQGYPGIMVTDTAPFRYPHYHKSSDTPDKIDYPQMARVVDGLTAVVDDLSNPGR